MPKILNIAHRGASGELPENTLAAFRLALRQGADGIETDVHQTLDREIVAIHDTNLRRLTGIRREIRDLTLKELKTLRIRRKKGPAIKTGRIPTLNDVLALIKGKVFLNIEIKEGSGTYPGIEKRVIALVKRNKKTSRVIFSSFDLSVLKTLRKLSGEIRLGLLTRQVKPAKILGTARAIRAASIHIAARRVSPALIRLAKKEGIPVYLYTVNTHRLMARFSNMGADGFFTDYPGRLNAFLRQREHHPRR
ncbi:MAG TPA: glycerophosphodiester phosphodiesterase family protein [Nitrospiria bacterium]